MALSHYSFTAIIDSDSSGQNIVAGQAVSVNLTTGGYATIYSDSAGASPIAQPGAVTDSDGVFEFYVASGTYEVTSGGRTEVISVTNNADKLIPVTEAEMIARSGVSSGDRFIVSDRANAIFEAKTGLTDNTWNIIQSTADGAIQFELVRDAQGYCLEHFGDLSTAANATAAFQAALDLIYDEGVTASNFRKSGQVLWLPPKYLELNSLDFGGALGTMGLTIRGQGAWATKLTINSGETFTAYGSSNLTFEDLTINSDSIDDDVVAFTVSTSAGGSLRTWRFNRCDFFTLYRCFEVTGSTVCSEFYFESCRFVVCYNLVHNSNVQALNWDFNNCDWEPFGLTTAKAHSDATAFHMVKGLGVNWKGGSMLLGGSLALFELTAGSAFSRFSHKLVFDNVRIEYRTVDSVMLRRHGSYVKGSNNPVVVIQNGTCDLATGTVGTNPKLFEIWEGCEFTFTNWDVEGGYVDNVIGAVSNTQWAKLTINNCRKLEVVDDRGAAPYSGANNIVDYSNIPAGVISEQVLPAITESRPFARDTTGELAPSFHLKSIEVTGITNTMLADGAAVSLPELNHLALLKSIEVRKFRDSTNNVDIFLENDSGEPVSITRSGATVTVEEAGHGRFSGDTVAISGVNEADYNGEFVITSTGADTYTYTIGGTPATPATGSPEARYVYGSVTIAAGDRYATAAVSGQAGFQTGSTSTRVRAAYSSGSEVIKGIISVNYT